MHSFTASLSLALSHDTNMALCPRTDGRSLPRQCRSCDILVFVFWTSNTIRTRPLGRIYNTGTRDEQSCRQYEESITHQMLLLRGSTWPFSPQCPKSTTRVDRIRYRIIAAYLLVRIHDRRHVFVFEHPRHYGSHILCAFSHRRLHPADPLSCQILYL